MRRFSAKVVFTLCFFVAVSSAVFSFGKFDEAKKKKPSQPTRPSKTLTSVETNETSIWEIVSEGQMVTVSGKIRRVGSEPMSFIVLTDSADKDWYLDEAGERLLQGYEQVQLRVTGTVELKEMTLANGKKLGARRILTAISIIN